MGTAALIVAVTVVPSLRSCTIWLGRVCLRFHHGCLMRTSMSMCSSFMLGSVSGLVVTLYGMRMLHRVGNLVLIDEPAPGLEVGDVLVGSGPALEVVWLRRQPVRMPASLGGSIEFRGRLWELGVVPFEGRVERASGCGWSIRGRSTS